MVSQFRNLPSALRAASFVMSTKTIHYVEFFFPGSFFPETQTQKINSRDDGVEAPMSCYGFRFFDVTETEADGEILTGKPKNMSCMYYFGEVYTVADVVNKVPNNSILLSNMKCNGWDRVVRTRRGNFQPLEDGDIVISEK